MYGQFMKFIRRGAVRIGTGEAAATNNHVALRNPDGTIVLIVTNGTNSAKKAART